MSKTIQEAGASNNIGNQEGTSKKVMLEIIWWIVTGIIVSLILIPIFTGIGYKYEFYTPNIFFIVIFVTYTRYIFLLRHTLIADSQWTKLVLVFLSIPLLFYAVDALYNFQDFVDQDNHITMLNHLDPEKAREVSNYFKYQFLFFGTGGIMVLLLMPIRMIVSIWRKLNRGTV